MKITKRWRIVLLKCIAVETGFRKNIPKHSKVFNDICARLINYFFHTNFIACLLCCKNPLLLSMLFHSDNLIANFSLVHTKKCINSRKCSIDRVNERLYTNVYIYIYQGMHSIQFNCHLIFSIKCEIFVPLCILSD